MANALGELFGDIAAAIRDKTGEEGKMKPAQFPEKISEIETGADVSVVTATAPHVLKGDVFVDADGNPVEGTMPNRGTIRKQLDTAQANYPISPGYYAGGNIYLLNDRKDATPTKEEQIIYPDSGRVLSHVTVAPIPDKYQDVTPVTATAGDVRAGKVIVDAEGNVVEGALAGTLADVSGVTATAEDVLEGKVIVDALGNEVVGTLIQTIISGSGSGTGDHLKFAQGTFVASADRKRQTVTHGFDTMPDMIIVFFNAIYSGTVEDFVSEYPLLMAWGMKSTFNSNMKGGTLVPGLGYASDPIDTINSTIGITCPDEKTFQVGSSGDGNGRLAAGKSYTWLAISGMGTVVNAEEKAPDVIWGTVTDDVAMGVVGSGVVRYVTFCNDDGTVTYGKKSVIAGENCVDPVVGGFMDAPTKESTEQYNYTFSGGINADALKNVTEDRTVYANFISAVRYYTVTYYDSDGVTVLKTESLAYGATPSYVPASADYTFDGWVPAAAAVTGDASYTAKWKAKPAFATASWADIKAAADAGEASTLFKLGDTKTVTITHTDGTTEDITFEIVDLFASSTELLSSSSSAHIACMATHAVGDPVMFGKKYYGSSYPANYYNTYLKDYAEELFALFPTDAKAAIAKVLVPGQYYSWNLMPPRAENILGVTFATRTSAVKTKARFDLCENGSRNITRDKDGNAVDTWMIDVCSYNSLSGDQYLRPQCIMPDGTISYSTSIGETKYFRPVFYI